MTPPEDLLSSYDELSPEERARADAHLSAHPEARVHLQEGRRLREVVRLAALPATPERTDQALADLVAARLMAASPPPALDTEEQHLLGLLEGRPELQARQRELAASAEQLLAASTPAAEHFEALSGRSLAPSRQGAPARPERRTRQHAPDRVAASPLRPNWLRLTSVTALLAVTLYGGLFLSSEALRTTPERLAALQEVPPAYQGLRLRGGDGEVDRVTDRYAAGREALLAARSSVLGLFPRYDDARLDEALRAFDAAWAHDAPPGPLGLEARFQAGRIHLYRGEVAAAREAFEDVAAQNGPSAPEARALLRVMQERGL